jgi:release factor glutamine methyltransferase
VLDPPFEVVRDRLRRAGCVAADDEATLLIDAASDPAALKASIIRREGGEPIAWIVGFARFCGRSVHIDPGVYVPRPHSEELARRAAGLLRASGRAVDLCTGSGAIAAHLEAEVLGATAIGVDIDPRAVRCANRNGVPTVLGDLDRALAGHAFDVVTAVAPYVPTTEIRLLPADVQRFEPRLALDGGADGLDLVRRIVTASARLLRPGGWLLTELGAEQDRALAPALSVAGFVDVETWFDHDGDLRGLAARAAV